MLCCGRGEDAMADSLVAGWLSDIGLEAVIPTFREVCRTQEPPRAPASRCAAEAADSTRAAASARPRGALARSPAGAAGSERTGARPVHSPSRHAVSSSGALTRCGPRQEGIDSEALAALDDAQLKELGVKRMGDRTKVLRQECTQGGGLCARRACVLPCVPVCPASRPRARCATAC